LRLVEHLAYPVRIGPNSLVWFLDSYLHKLFNTIMEQGGKVVLCGLALENKGIDPKNVRDERIVIEKVPPFLMDAEGAEMTYTFWLSEGQRTELYLASLYGTLPPKWAI
jgi:hypothetical protein